MCDEDKETINNAYTRSASNRSSNPINSSTLQDFMSKSAASVPSHPYMKLLLRGIPETVDLIQCLQAMALKSLYTYYNPKQQTAWIALAPAPSENDLLPICQQLMNTTQALSIEKAPLQKIPRAQSVRRDAVSNSIESDPHYVKFLETIAKDGMQKPGAKATIESEKGATPIAPIIAFLANREKNPKSQALIGPPVSEPPNRAARRKKPRKKKEKKKKTDNPESAASTPTTSAATVIVKPLEPSVSGVKILTKANSNPNVRWQIKQPNNTSTG